MCFRYGACSVYIGAALATNPPAVVVANETLTGSSVRNIKLYRSNFTARGNK